MNVQNRLRNKLPLLFGLITSSIQTASAADLQFPPSSVRGWAQLPTSVQDWAQTLMDWGWTIVFAASIIFIAIYYIKQRSHKGDPREQAAAVNSTLSLVFDVIILVVAAAFVYKILWT